jgi:hypothetical protein
VQQNGSDGLAENNSGAAGMIHFCGDLDCCDMPLIASVDQQRGPARTTGSRAVRFHRQGARRFWAVGVIDWFLRRTLWPRSDVEPQGHTCPGIAGLLRLDAVHSGQSIP